VDAPESASGEAYYGIARRPPLAANHRGRHRAFVAAVIERSDTVFGRRFDIAGDELTGDQAAAILSKVTGREIRYEGFPPEVLRAQSENMARMFGWFDSTGYAADIKNLRRDFPEVMWHTFEQWAREQDWSVLDQS
jgi:uncharacterized protein YbjT (DUF2867 family)